jgi:hypothetical protein
MGNVDELIQVQVLAARVACEQITSPALKRLADSVDRACCLPSKPGWERKAVAHAEIFRLLADVAGQAGAVGPLAAIDELMCMVGPAANGIITSSRRRLLARMGAGDAEGAAREMESHLRVLHYMGRLARRPGATAQANRAWVRDTLWRKDRQFAALLDHVLSTEVVACDPALLPAWRKPCCPFPLYLNSPRCSERPHTAENRGFAAIGD